jgi:DNA-binding HxlR family transcriptional regulator
MGRSLLAALAPLDAWAREWADLIASTAQDGDGKQTPEAAEQGGQRHGG